MKSKFSIAFLKFKESLYSILPIFLIAFLLAKFTTDISTLDMLAFFIASLFLVFGMFLFSVGADNSMMLIGENIGSSLSKSRKLLLFVITSFILGFVVSIAEPDLMVLAKQVSNVNNFLFIAVCGIGVGILMLVAILRIIFQIKLKYILGVSYLVILILLFIAPNDFLPIAFDASGVTTGPISSPFILAFGLGVSAVRSSKNSEEDSFGLIALSSIGPIIVVLLLGIISSSTINSQASTMAQPYLSFMNVIDNFVKFIFEYLFSVGIVVFALILIFLIFNHYMLKLPKIKIKKIFIGLFTTYIGIVVYLVGVSIGYYPISMLIGSNLINNGGLYLLIPLSVIIGFSIIIAEPAVHVLIKKVFEITSGIIRKKALYITLTISMSIGIILSAVKIIYNINIMYILLPLIVIIIILLFITPDIFISIAFDAGGVASGPMSTSFLLPLSTGLAVSLQFTSAQHVFGIIGIVSLMPLITLQILGVMFRYTKWKKYKNSQPEKPKKRVKIEIISFGE